MRARDSLHLTDFVNIMNEASEPENLLLREKVSYQVEMTGSYHTRWAAVGRLLEADGRVSGIARAVFSVAIWRQSGDR